jgi:hypothetical protein
MAHSVRCAAHNHVVLRIVYVGWRTIKTFSRAFFTLDGAWFEPVRRLYVVLLFLLFNNKWKWKKKKQTNMSMNVPWQCFP